MVARGEKNNRLAAPAVVQAHHLQAAQSTGFVAPSPPSFCMPLGFVRSAQFMERLQQDLATRDARLQELQQRCAALPCTAHHVPAVPPRGSTSRIACRPPPVAANTVSDTLQTPPVSLLAGTSSWSRATPGSSRNAPTWRPRRRTLRRWAGQRAGWTWRPRTAPRAATARWARCSRAPWPCRRRASGAGSRPTGSSQSGGGRGRRRGWRGAHSWVGAGPQRLPGSKPACLFMLDRLPYRFPVPHTPCRRDGLVEMQDDHNARLQQATEEQDATQAAVGAAQVDGLAWSCSPWKRSCGRTQQISLWACQGSCGTALNASHGAI